MLNNKTILVTGGTGSFGKKFIGIVLNKYKPKKIIVFSRDEMKQYEMAKRFNHPCIRYFIGDIRDADRLHRAFNGVNIVVHAAALKIVPAAEYNPFEVVRTNVIGAENIINMAIDNKINKVIALSTDKAVDPINLYGATKLCAEKLFIAANNYVPMNQKTCFSVARYGNVVGSRGSVIPFFKECAQKGEIPITDSRMTRFWLTLEQGVHFVLQCIREMGGGEIFIPKIPSMKVVDLAKAIAPHCRLKIIGVRPGEKLHETLLSQNEGTDAYELKEKFIIYSKVIPRWCRKYRGKNLGLTFTGYRSDNNTEWLSVNQIRKIIAKEP